MAKTQCDDLLKGDHTMLSCGDRDDEPIDLAPGIAPSAAPMVEFRPTMGRFSTIAGHGAMVAAQSARVAGRLCL